MNKQDLIELATNFVEKSEENVISKQIAPSEATIGMRIFEAPIFSFGDADDDYFKLLLQPSVIGKHFMLPREWLADSKTVISFFLPFTEAVKKGNSREKTWPSEEWLLGRVEGQAFLNKLCQHLSSELINAGYQSVVPSLDKRFNANTGSEPGPFFTSNWSERHIAYVCGHGTFGLSKGLITNKGVAGRFGSIITKLNLSPDKREYKDIYQYCTMCGSCIKNCPVNAISIDKGKNHPICAEFLDKTAEKYRPRYGCGKCNTGVPCESRIP